LVYDKIYRKDITEYIGVQYTTVSRAIKKIEGEDEK
jgi:DNA-binding MarR family transcriptional regulator